MRLTCAALLTVAASASATELGLDMNRPLTGGAVNLAAVTALGQLRPGWVRVNFVLDVWSGPGDATRRGPDQLTWFEAYDRLVDGYLAQGIQVYGLLGQESTTATGATSSDGWQTQFVTDAAAIVGHFKDRVHVWELFNEPNNWVSPNTPALDASGFAHLLARSYQRLKLDHAGDPCWQVTLLSGPLFSFDGTTAADFLSQTYAAGKASWGWSAMRSSAGTYPLDGVAYHLYVAQGPNETAATVKSKVTGNLQAIWSVMATEEGAASVKRIWVSEMGWRTGAVSEQQQADFMQAGLEALATFGRVPVGVYFALQDFGSNDEWGLYRGQPYDAAHAKLIAGRFTSLAPSYRGLHDAAVEPASVPLRLTPGVSSAVTLRFQNTGRSAWPAGGPVRLGAWPGCPAPAANELAWTGFADGGTSGVLDARAFLAAEVAPGATAELAFDVSALGTGTRVLSARMVEDGVGWFGAPFSTTVEVVAEDGGAGPADAGSGADGGPGLDAGAAPADGGDAARDGGADAQDPEITGACGCGAAGTPALAGVLLVALALSRRRAGLRP